MKFCQKKTKMLKSATKLLRFQYSPLCGELKKQTDIAKNNIKVWTSFLNLIKK